VTSFHGYQRRYLANVGREHPFDDLFKKGDLFLACSEHMKRWFEGLGLEAEKAVVHRYGVNVGRFLPANGAEKSTSGQVRLLSVGRLVEKKGFEYGIRGVARTLRSYRNIQYEIAGDGPERPKLEQLIAKLGVASNVKLLGWQERKEIIRLMGQADIFLAPGITSQTGDQDGIPRVLHEAMA
jgi:colanic acid/amylovoran biosynthesis glycosyltransferase